MMDAQTLVLLSNVDGIYDGNPSDPKSEVIRTIKTGEDLSCYIQAEKSSAGRGGMASKYRTASSVAAAGIKVVIANGNRENILKDLAERPNDTIHTEWTSDR